MNEIQRKLFENNIDLAETLAGNATCAEADYDELLREAERALADAVMKYDQKRHGDFEKYATTVIRQALDRMVYSNGNGIFTIVTKREKEETMLFFGSGEEVLQAELDALHRGFENY